MMEYFRAVMPISRRRIRAKSHISSMVLPSRRAICLMWVYIRILSRTAPPSMSQTERPQALPLISHSAISMPLMALMAMGPPR